MATAKSIEKKEPFIHIVKRDALPWWKSWGIRALALVAAIIAVGVISYIVTKVSPIDVYRYIIDGAFGTTRKTMKLLRTMSMLLIISLAVTPAFRMKFWNIGAEGQVLISAFAGFFCIHYLGGTVNNTLLLFIMLGACLIAGAVWAVIPAVFKAVWNTNETLFTLMMNYVAVQIVSYSIKIWVPGGTGVLQPSLTVGALP